MEANPKGKRSLQAHAYKGSASKSDSKLQPATTVASHDEGTVPIDEPALLTWRDYDPEGGMPLPQGELTQPEIDAIFGQDTDEQAGNYILNVMNWRRRSGALIDVGLQLSPQLGDIPRQTVLNGLEYVRSCDPGFDEQAAGENWAYEESERLKEALRQRSINLGLYKSDEPDVFEEEESDQGTQQGRTRSGESILQSQREEKEAAWEEEQAQREVREQREEQASVASTRGPLDLSAGVQPSAALTTAGPNGVAISKARTKAWLQPVERKEWVKHYEQQAQIIKDNEVPHLHILQRLGPPLLFALIAVGGCIYLSDNYTPPPKSARMYPDTPPAVATITALATTICAMFVLGRLPMFWRTSSKYFTIVPAYPYAASLLGAAFRHDTARHLLGNIVTLWIFGISLHEEVGRGTFLAIFLGSSVLGGYSSLLYNVLRKQWMAYIHGSSGGILGIVGASCFLKPEGSLKIFGYDVRFSAWILGAFWGIAELVAAVRMRKTNIDHAGHVGGMITGAAAAAYLKWRAQNDQSVMKQTPAEQSIAQT